MLYNSNITTDNISLPSVERDGILKCHLCLPFIMDDGYLEEKRIGEGVLTDEVESYF